MKTLPLVALVALAATSYASLTTNQKPVQPLFHQRSVVVEDLDAVSKAIAFTREVGKATPLDGLPPAPERCHDQSYVRIIDPKFSDRFYVVSEPDSFRILHLSTSSFQLMTLQHPEYSIITKFIFPPETDEELEKVRDIFEKAFVECDLEKRTKLLQRYEREELASPDDPLVALHDPYLVSLIRILARNYDHE